MADYIFYSGPDTGENFSATKATANQFTISTGTFLLNDAVYTPLISLYGIYTASFRRKVPVDIVN